MKKLNLGDNNKRVQALQRRLNRSEIVLATMAGRGEIWFPNLTEDGEPDLATPRHSSENDLRPIESTLQRLYALVVIA